MLCFKKSKKKKNKSSRQCRGRTAGVCKPSAPEVVATVCAAVFKRTDGFPLSLSFLREIIRKGEKIEGGQLCAVERL